MDPELILADHPTSWQDAEGAERVCEAFYEVASRGTSVLVFGRDQALRSIAERNKWKQMALIDGRLVGMEELADQAIDEGFVDLYFIHREVFELRE